jgi:hypothetical protein
MSYVSRIFFTLCTAGATFSLPAQETQRPELTARELFYNAGAASSSASTSSAASTAKAPKKVVAKKKPVEPEAQRATSAPPSQPSQQATTSAQYGGGQVIPVSDSARASAPAPASGTALGLKYTILKLSGETMTPVAPSSVFHAGDKIQFSIETNGPGYLYIVSHGSSGTWTPMFPSPEIEAGNNRVEGFHTYRFPNGYRYVFDQQSGDEKIFIIFSRDAKPDFEQMVYSLKNGKTKSAPQPASQTAPAADDKSTPVLRASIEDSTVGRLHETYARDLVIERVGDDTHSNTPDSAMQEKAVYVVNASGNADSALVADLNLVHQ